MRPYHSLLNRQLRKVFDGKENIPENVIPLVELVDEAYRQFDEERHMLERSLDLSAQELLHANSDIRSALESLLDIYFRVDQAGTILFYRRGHNETMFNPATDLTGKKLLDLPNKKMGAFLQNAAGEVNRDKKTIFLEFDVRLGEQDCFYEAWLVPIHNHQVNIMIRNVSEVKRARANEQELQARLARSERMESLGLLAGGVAHDLNNILSPLVAYPELILADLEKGSPARRMVMQIQNSALRASAIIRDLLTLARRGSFNPELVNINQVIKIYTQSADFIALRNRYPCIEFKTRLTPDCAYVETAAHHIGQTVMNLVINAFEAIVGVGEVTIATEVLNVEKPCGKYETVAPGQYVCLRVSDTGAGMTPDIIEHIFEPFYTRKKMGISGSGLGLTVVYGTVKDSDGYIDIHSEKDKGTTFSLYFPTRGLTPTKSVQSGLNELRGSGSILVVDDMPQQRELAVYLLGYLGYETKSAANHDEAVALASSRKFDIVLLDMILEDKKDGLDVFMSLRNMDPELRCLIISGFAESERVEKAIELGALGFMSKPYTLETLGRRIKEAMKA
ncbi:MAG TPA: response regulator [Kiritimatiellia bacterium]|nr:response regulator [Kiritimatiellia bacterium]